MQSYDQKIYKLFYIWLIISFCMVFIMIVVGGVVPKQDYEELYEAGAALIFGPGTVISIAAIELVEKLNEQFGYVK